MWGGEAWAALACGTATNSTATGTDPWNITYSTDAGSDRVIILRLMARNAGAATPDPTGVTQAGNAMTMKVNTSTAPSNANEGWIYYIVNPTGGSNTVAIDWSTVPSHATASLITCTGADQGADPFRGAASSATGTSTAPSVSVTSASGDIVFDVVVSALSALTVNGSQTEDSNQFIGGGNLVAGASHEGGAASVSMDWTLAASRGWTIAGVSLKAAASTAVQQNLMLMGVGN